MHTKGWPPPREVLIIKWTGWSVLWIPVCTFSQPLLSLHGGLMDKLAMMAGMEVRHESGTHRPLWMKPQSVRSNWILVNSPTWHTSMRVASPLPGDRLITLDHFHHGRSSILLLLEQKLNLNMNSPSWQSKTLAKLPLVDLQIASSTFMPFHTALL